MTSTDMETGMIATLPVAVRKKKGETLFVCPQTTGYSLASLTCQAPPFSFQARRQ